MGTVYKIICIGLLALQLAGCATGSYVFNRGAFCEDVAVRNGFTKELITTDRFTLLAYRRFVEKGKPVVIYIEGDGLAWESRSRLSGDPTPKDPLVIELASIDPAPNVAYLARPGQYNLSGASPCDPSYWSDKRYSEEVIASMNEAIEYLKKRSGAGNIDVVGYSGGAAIGVLIASRRGDVASLRTVAGNLDPDAVNRYNNVSPLKGSLNPIDFVPKVSRIPQRHFASASDSVIPISITESFAEKIGDQRYESITIVKGTDHTTGWQRAWSSLINVPLYKRDSSAKQDAE